MNTLSPITAADLSDRARWRGGTHGLDGWRYRELRLLPYSIWELLATFLNALEADPDPTWPRALSWGSIPLLPKEGPPGPLNLRPLTILSVIYRIWAGIRASQLRGWQETWIHRSLHGGRAGHETLDGVFETNLDIEQAQLDAKELFLLLLDYKKLFDFILQEHIWALAAIWGMPKSIIRMLRSFYINLLSVFKFNGHFGDPWKRTNSLAQGCSFSMMLQTYKYLLGPERHYTISITKQPTYLLMSTTK